MIKLFNLRADENKTLVPPQNKHFLKVKCKNPLRNSENHIQIGEAVSEISVHKGKKNLKPLFWVLLCS